MSLIIKVKFSNIYNYVSQRKSGTEGTRCEAIITVVHSPFSLPFFLCNLDVTYNVTLWSAVLWGSAVMLLVHNISMVCIALKHLCPNHQ